MYSIETTKRFDKDVRRCLKRGLNIQPDWLMTWQQNDTQLTLLFLQTGTHADLF